MEPAASWDDLAGWWRTTFANGADIEYELQILPLCCEELEGCAKVLDIGTGEGQLARRLAGRAGKGALVVGVDPYAAQLGSAAEQGGGVSYLRAAGESLPFRDGAFDGVVCCLVVEHADDGDLLLAEAARVVSPKGRFVLLVNHPLTQGPQSGLIDDTITGERYWRIGPYLSEVATVEEVDPGVKVRFSHRPLSRYVNTLCEKGLVLSRLEEPAPPRGFLVDSIDIELEAATPRLCLMVFERR
ncbi:MAG: class I SAM-dependent methyltransferase [Acidimicrobiales bacterium]